MPVQRGERLARRRVPDRAVLSSEAVTTRAPSGLNAAESTHAPCAAQRGELPCPSPRSRPAPSCRREAVTTRAPSGLNAAELTELRVPLQRGDRLARRRVPDPRRLVLRGRDDARAVRAERRGLTRPALPAQLARSACPVRRGSQHRAPSCVRHERASTTARAVRAERGGVHLPWCPRSAAIGLPVAASQTRAVLSRRGDDPRAVRAERGGVHPVRVPAQRGDLLARRGVRHARGLVVRGRHDARAVRAERRGVDPSMAPGT